MHVWDDATWRAVSSSADNAGKRPLRDPFSPDGQASLHCKLLITTIRNVGLRVYAPITA